MHDAGCRAVVGDNALELNSQVSGMWRLVALGCAWLHRSAALRLCGPAWPVSYGIPRIPRIPLIIESFAAGARMPA